MKTFIDQMGRSIVLEATPQRIISLVPSQSELLYDLGLDEEVIGISKFCIYPETWFRTKNRIGGTKQVDIPKVKELKPDLIIGNKEENTEADILELEKIAPVWMSDIYTFEDAYSMIRSIGEICARAIEADKIVEEIQSGLAKYQKPTIKAKAMYLIWYDPLMAAGKQTFIDEVMQQFGFDNYYADKERYPICEFGQKPNPEYILLSSEPFPFQEKHKQELQVLYPDSKILFVDGELFSWYGSRMRLLGDYFEKLKKELRIEN